MTNAGSKFVASDASATASSVADTRKSKSHFFFTSFSETDRERDLKVLREDFGIEPLWEDNAFHSRKVYEGCGDSARANKYIISL